MLFDVDRRYSLLIFSLMVILMLLIVASCTVNELPAQENPANVTPAVTSNITNPSMFGINSFTAQPETIKPGETTILSWKVTGASSLSIDPDIGSVTGTSGSVSIAPQGTTLYTLTACDARCKMIARFLVIVKTADGAIVWPTSSSDNITTEPLYEGWSHYPNKYVVWDIIDRNKDTATDTVNCWHQGRIINNHTEWMMTGVTVSDRLIADKILPSAQRIYVTSMDCLQLPELKWKWKVYP